MRRRDLLAGLGALGIFGGGAAALHLSGSDDTIQSSDLPRIEAEGSPAGTVAVPAEGQVSFVSLFATWCGICQEKMAPLGEAYRDLDDDVQFISVTNEPVGQTIEPEAVADWWDDYDGFWPLAHDEGLDLTRAVDAPGVPYSIVFTADNEIAWSDGGYKSAEEILARIDDAR